MCLLPLLLHVIDELCSVAISRCYSLIITQSCARPYTPDARSVVATVYCITVCLSLTTSLCLRTRFGYWIFGTGYVCPVCFAGTGCGCNLCRVCILTGRSLCGRAKRQVVQREMSPTRPAVEPQRPPTTLHLSPPIVW